MTIICELNATKLAAIAGFKSTEETRYYLCGVQIEPSADGGVVMVATDGHVMGAMTDADGTLPAGDHVIVPVSKDLLKACKRGKNEARERVVSVAVRRFMDDTPDEHTVSVLHWPLTYTSEANAGDCPGVTVATFPIEIIDGTFPDWRRVFGSVDVPATGGGGSAFFAFNQALLKPFGLGLKGARIVLGITDASTATIIHVEDISGSNGDLAGSFVGLMMPMRAGSERGGCQGLPAKFAAPAKPEAAVAA